MAIGALNSIPIVLMSETSLFSKILIPAFAVGVGALSGWLDGLIVDYFSNKTAKKYSNDTIQLD